MGIMLFKEFLTEAVIGNSKPEYFKKYIEDVYETAVYSVVNKLGDVDVFDSSGKKTGSLPSGTIVKIINPTLTKFKTSFAAETDKGYIKTTNIEKPKVVTKMNMGDAAEGVIFAAIYLKHTRGRSDANSFTLEKITENDILSFVSNIKWTVSSGISSFKVSESVPGIGGVIDTVDGELYLKKASAEALIDRRNVGSIKALAKESANMVNSRNFERFVKILHVNEKQNHIKISGLGPLDESGQKIDLSVTIDGKTTRYNSISLKRDSVQLGQKGIGGLPNKSFESAKEFFQKYLFVDISSVQPDYIDKYIDSPQESTLILAKEALQLLEKKSQTDLVAALINSFRIGAFGGEDITVFDINKASRMNISNVAAFISNLSNLRVKDVSKTYGELSFMADRDGKQVNIAKIRFKFENSAKVRRIYFETAPELKKLFKL